MQTVGDILRAAREQQGISVKDVEKATSIRAIYLQAIEDGNYKLLPGEVYVKGFIRNYANFMGLDGQAMVDKYRQSEHPEPLPATNETKKVDRKESKKSRSKLFVAILVILLLAGGGWLTMSYWSNPTPPPAPPVVPPLPPSTSQAPLPPATAPAPVIPVPPPPPAALPPQVPAPTSQPVVLVATFTGKCWTSVTADNTSIYEGIPNVGESLTWKADKTITAIFGNAGGVNLTLNGKPQGKAGNPGEVIAKTFSATTALQQQH